MLELAWQEARSLGHSSCDTEHILLGLVAEWEGVAARVLRDLGADPETIRNETIRMLSGPSRRTAASAGAAELAVSHQHFVVAASRPQLLVACPACATPIETVTVDQRNAATHISLEGVHTCPRCEKRWRISVTANWHDPAPPEHPEDDLGHKLTVWHYSESAHFTMNCFRCELALERVSLDQTTPPIQIEYDGERTCTNCNKPWHISYTVSWEESGHRAPRGAPGRG